MKIKSKYHYYQIDLFPNNQPMIYLGEYIAKSLIEAKEMACFQHGLDKKDKRKMGIVRTHEKTNR